MAPNKGKRRNIWFHFTEEAEHLRAKCNYCALTLSIKSGSLGNLNRHMKNRHPMIALCVVGKNEGVTPCTSTTVNAAVAAASASASSSTAVSAVSNERAATATVTGLQTVSARTATATQPIGNYFRRPPSERNVDQLNRQLVKMVDKGHHALRIVEEPEFKCFIEMVSRCPGYQLPTRKTLTDKLIPKIYMEVFQQYQKKIADSPAVCLGTDEWTATTTDRS